MQKSRHIHIFFVSSNYYYKYKKNQKEDGISLIHGYINTKLFCYIRISTLRFTQKFYALLHHRFTEMCIVEGRSAYVCAYVCVVVSSKTLKNLLMQKLFYADKKMHSNQRNRIIHKKMNWMLNQSTTKNYAIELITIIGCVRCCQPMISNRIPAIDIMIFRFLKINLRLVSALFSGCRLYSYGWC